jgi:hypothetical protein
VPNGILNPHGKNSIAIAVWNLDGSTGGLGKVSLTNYGSYASSLRVGMNRSPGYHKRKYAMPPAPGTRVRLRVPDSAQSDQTFTARTTVRVPPKGAVAHDVHVDLRVPSGWTVTAATPTSAQRLVPGTTFAVRWRVSTPAGALPQAARISAIAHYRQSGRSQRNDDERIVRAVPPPPPAGTDAVSDLPFLSASNGWGPVERDSSNGEQAAGDGSTITINGETFPKGLGTNSVSDVQIYLAGGCSRFTTKVGVDDETDGAGTVTFSVLADGKNLVTTPTIRGHQDAVAIDVDVSSAQVVDLVVGDAGDGNGHDHADWAQPTLACG